MNWKEFVEELSVVDKILGNDPAEAYLKMDFTSRDHYRHIIENISKNSDLSEAEVAHEALKLAESARQKMGKKIRSSHVGYYLIDKGLSQLEEKADVRLSFPVWLKTMCFRRPLLFYTLSILLLTAAISWSFVRMIHRVDLPEWMPWLHRPRLNFIRQLFYRGTGKLAGYPVRPSQTSSKIGSLRRHSSRIPDYSGRSLYAFFQ